MTPIRAHGTFASISLALDGPSSWRKTLSSDSPVGVCQRHNETPNGVDNLDFQNWLRWGDESLPHHDDKRASDALYA